MHVRVRLLLPAAALYASVALNAAPASAPVGFDQFLPPPRDVKGAKIGPQSCLMLQSEVELDGQVLRRLDFGLNGTVDGFMTKDGEYSRDVINTPDLVYPQSGDPGPIFPAIATYERDKGAAMTIVLPREAAWNGKAWVTAHGGGPSFVAGSVARVGDRTADGEPQRAFTRYELLMLRQGFALVKTRRTATQAKTGLKGDIRAVLEDGTVVEDASFNETPQDVVDFAVVARRVITDQMKRAAVADGLLRALLRRAHGPRPQLHAWIQPRRHRDSRFLTVSSSMIPRRRRVAANLSSKAGSDVMLQSAADKAAMVPQLEVAHQMYNNIWLPDVKKPEWTTSSYLENKRRNATHPSREGPVAEVPALRNPQHQPLRKWRRAGPGFLHGSVRRNARRLGGQGCRAAPDTL